MTVITVVKTAIQKRAAYNHLKYELQTMRPETAIDLGLFPEDAALIAARAIYGESRVR